MTDPLINKHFAKPINDLNESNKEVVENFRAIKGKLKGDILDLMMIKTRQLVITVENIKTLAMSAGVPGPHIYQMVTGYTLSEAATIQKTLDVLIQAGAISADEAKEIDRLCCNEGVALHSTLERGMKGVEQDIRKMHGEDGNGTKH